MDDSSVRVYGTSGEVPDRMADGSANLLENVRSRLNVTDMKRWIEDHPTEATLAALGLGLVTAMLVTPGRRDKYDKLEHRLQKAMKDVVQVKKEAEGEIAEVRSAVKSSSEEQHKAEKRARKAEKELDKLREHVDDDDGGSRVAGASWRALIFSAVGAQLVHLLTRWVSNRMLTDRTTGGDERVGYDQPVSGEYTYTPPI